jgi:hypothetical protein
MVRVESLTLGINLSSPSHGGEGGRMRRLLALLFVFLLTCPLMAQVRTGNIFGKVVDIDGEPLPGVTVTLTGSFTAPVSTVTAVEGLFRFVSLASGKDYALKAELEGFKTDITEGIIVTSGSNVEMTLVLEVGGITEEVIVVADTPVVDSKKVAIGMNVTTDILQSIPTARDPWVLMQITPGVQIGRENIGGVESGHQSLPTGRGSTGYSDNQYVIDGAVISGPWGYTTVYYDMDAFEEMNIQIGGHDVTVQSGGVSINFVSKRGGNKVSGGARFYMSDEKFQADNFTEELAKEGLRGINNIRRNKDWGFNLGLPIIKDKLWFWGAYGDMQVRSNTIYQTPHSTNITVLTGKLNLQVVPANRFEAYLSGHQKALFGGDANASNPLGRAISTKYHFGTPVLKIQDEHMFGDDLMVSYKFYKSWPQSKNVPMFDMDRVGWTTWDYTDERWYGSMDGHEPGSFRTNWTHTFIANYFNDNLLGASHDVKAGFEVSYIRSGSEWGFPGNTRLWQNYDFGTVDLDGDGLPDVPDSNFYKVRTQRSGWRYNGATYVSGFLSDTLSFGRFNLLLGLRYDYQTPWLQEFVIESVKPDHPVYAENFTSAAANALGNLLPGVPIPTTEINDADGNPFHWTSLSPRIGITWDVTGDGKTIAKLSYSQYRQKLPQGEANNWYPGGTSGWNEFWWMDDGDGMVDVDELYWHTIATYSPYRVFDDAGNFVGNLADAAGTFYGSYDPANPVNLTAPTRTFASDAQGHRTRDIIATVEREVFTDFSLQLNATYRRYDQRRWRLSDWRDTNTFDNQSLYASAGKPPANIPGLGSTKDAANHEWYYKTAEGTEYTAYSQYQRRPDYYQHYLGFDLVATKRLSNRWMLNASFTYQHQSENWGDTGYLNPTNKWAWDGTTYSPLLGGGSGKLSQYIYSRWYFKAAGLYQLPYDFNVAGTILMREGYIIRETFGIQDYRLPNPKSNSATLDMTPFGTERLPTSLLVTFRIEKVIRISEFGRAILMLDLFNALNAKTINRRYQRFHGTYYMFPDESKNYFVSYPNDFALNEILNPRILRIGMRIEF